MQFPELKWSAWYPWSRRIEIENYNRPGIYRLAIGTKSKLDDLNGWGRVRYIGMTLAPADPERPLARTGLSKRWNQLDRSMRGGDGHSGGKRMFAAYGALEGDRFPGKNGLNAVFVSACPLILERADPGDVDIDNPTRLRMDGMILYLEYAAFAEYCKARPRNRRPKFNRK